MLQWRLPYTRLFWRFLFAAMGRSGPRAADISISELSEGDWVFCERPSFASLLNIIVGDEWKHLGIVVSQNGKLVLADIGPAGFNTRSFDEADLAYTRMAILRPPLSECCRRSISETIRRHRSVDYNQSAFFVGAIYLFARRFGLGLHPWVLDRLRHFVARRPDAVGQLCSTYVLVMASCCVDTASIPLSGDRSVDAWLSPVVATPTDMWRSGLGHRFELGHHTSRELEMNETNPRTRPGARIIRYTGATIISTPLGYLLQAVMLARLGLDPVAAVCGAWGPMIVISYITNHTTTTSGVVPTQSVKR